MGAEPNAAIFQPSTTLDEATAVEKLRRKRRNKCAEIQRAASELADEFDWLEETIHDSDILEEDRTLLRTVLDAMKRSK